MIPRFPRAATLAALASSACLILSSIGLAAAARPAAEEVEPQHEAGFRALVFSKVTNFYHQSIPAGIATIEALGDEHDFDTVVTDDSSIFNDDDLATFDVVIFNNTNSTPQSGDLLNAEQREAFVRYIENGGGWVGLHSASGSERDWEWYEGLVGAIFSNHPPGELPDGTIPGRVKVTDRVHPSTQHLPEVWRHDEEWYNFGTNPTGDVHVLTQIDTKVGIEGLQLGNHHPFSWCQLYEGGRSWYTAGGHSPAAFDDDDFVQHLLGGIEWAAGAVDGDCGGTVEHNFEKSLLERNLVDPMELAVAPDGRVFVIERTGGVKVWHPDTRQTTKAGELDVYVAHTHGLNGLSIDPNFAENGWIYLYHSPPDTDHHRLSRFTMDGDTLDMDSEVVLLEVEAQRDTNAHEAGSMTWDENGNLYLATGDNSIPTEYTPIDERSGEEYRDAQRSSGNTNDLRGKILRITPQPDGSYTIPEGNLFAGDDSGLTRPEIYTMGHRQPYRIHYDEPSGRLLWGDVGPDAHQPDPGRGPMGYDEFHHTTEPGNFGWPHCRGGEAYRDYDFATGASGELFDCANGPVNGSPNNTGQEQLPAVNPPEIWYPYDWANYPDTPPFPELGNGGRLALSGPVYRYDPDLESETKFPEYYDGKWFIAEWTRGWIKTASIAESDHTFDDYPDVAAGDVYSIDPFMDSTTFLRPHDMVFGPDGSLYLLEWGSNYGGTGRGDPNDDSGLYRIDYVQGSRSPVAVASGTPDSGPVPLTVEFSSEGTHHPDGLAYELEWSFGDGTTSTEPNPTHTYTEPGDYTAQLVVTDPNDRQGFANVAITAGNARPDVNIVTPLHGSFVEDGQSIEFEVEVTDAEDGSTSDGTIDCADVQVQPYLGHADHAHPLEIYHDCTGSFEIQLDEGHAWHDNYWYLLDASYADQGAQGAGSLTGGEQIILQPKRKQAEHFTSSSGIQVVQMGEDEGSEQQLGGAVVGHIGHGDWVSYEPVNLARLEAMTFHVNSAGLGGQIEARAGGPEGELLGDPVQVPVTGDDWRANFVDVALELDPDAVPDGPFELYLVFTNDENQDVTNGLFNVHWMVAGEGATEPEETLVVGDLGTEELPMLAGQPATVDLSLQNQAAGTDAEATVTLEAPDGWHVSEETVTVPASESATVELTVTPPPTPAAATLTTAVSSEDLPVIGSASLHVASTVSGDDAAHALDGGAAGSPVLAGHQRLSPEDIWSEDTGFGWVGEVPASRDRSAPDDLRRDFVGHTGPRALRIELPPGESQAYLLHGDNGFPAHPMSVYADGELVAESDEPLPTGTFEWLEFTLDGGGDGRTVDLELRGRDGQWWHLGGLVIDRCPVQDQRPTVVVGGVDSEVPNRTTGDGCTVNDAIRDQDDWPDHGAFVRHVDAVTTELVATGVITDREKGAVMRSAARSDVGRE